MHRAPSSRWLYRALQIGKTLPVTGVPLFLCPTVAVGPSAAVTCRRTFSPIQCRHNTTEVGPASSKDKTVEPVSNVERQLPITCSGCGSFTQTSDPHDFGYFDTRAKRIRSWISPEVKSANPAEKEGNRIVEDALKALDAEQLKELGLGAEIMMAGESKAAETVQQPPICERCHDLRHHNLATTSTKIAMHHPTVESLRETIEESPHKYNHIYHVVDAADFPMSLIPRLNVLLGDINLRSRNRRSRAAKYISDRQTEMSFIITRSDLLGPTKDKVDKLMPIIREVLRDALGRVGDRVRLGNVRCVSAMRGWWTKEVRDDIWKRGGAGWMVGKVNVGKSQLFEAVYPKGRMKKMAKASAPSEASNISTEVRRFEELEMGDLLPPAQPATNYPEMPVVSSHPGTTASPIRIPFGDSKGELIDLPGLARSDLDLFVQEKHRKSLIMKKRIVPEQISIQQGKSLLLGGGLIRITPRNENLVFLAYNFTPLEEHRTSTEKAKDYQSEQRHSDVVENICIPGAGESMKHAGTFELRHDVTKRRAGPLTSKNLRALDVESLPFRVLATDILIEGVGYVELVAQVRAKAMKGRRREYMEEVVEVKDDSSDPFAAMMALRKDSGDQKRKTTPVIEQKRTSVRRVVVEHESAEPEWPAVDVYSPEGRFIGSRRPIGGWLSNKPLVKPEHKRSRPRKSMKGHKKMAKKEKRAKQAAAAAV